MKLLTVKHDIVFTHGDLDLHSIIVKDGHISGIIYWECAGWMPEYWESVKMRHGQSDKDWCRLVLESFPGYDDEIAADSDLWYVSGRL